MAPSPRVAILPWSRPLKTPWPIRSGSYEGEVENRPGAVGDRPGERRRRRRSRSQAHAASFEAKAYARNMESIRHARHATELETHAGAGTEGAEGYRSRRGGNEKY